MANEEYDVIQLNTESNPELAQDIGRLQDKIDAALDFYHQLREKHGDLWGDYIDNKLPVCASYALTPLAIWPDEDKE